MSNLDTVHKHGKIQLPSSAKLRSHRVLVSPEILQQHAPPWCLREFKMRDLVEEVLAEYVRRSLFSTRFDHDQMRPFASQRVLPSNRHVPRRSISPSETLLSSSWKSVACSTTVWVSV